MVKKYFGKLRSFHFFRRNFVLSPPGNKNARTCWKHEPGEILWKWYMAKLENSPLSPDAKAYMDAILSDDYWEAYMSQLEAIQSKALETLNIMMANLRRMEEERKSLTNNTNQHEGE